MAEGMGRRERGVDLAATAVSFLHLLGVRVERDGRVQEWQGCRSETNRVWTAWVHSQGQKSKVIRVETQTKPCPTCPLYSLGNSPSHTVYQDC